MDDASCHRSLTRQLRRLGASAGTPPDAEQWAGLLRLVSDSYRDADDGRYTLERSITISSQEMRALHDVLSRQARTDTLTGLPNRAALTEHIAAALGARDGGRPAILFIDLDGFKLINDALGHGVGDELLIRTAERIRAAIRDDDVVARLGGDEFVVLCPGVADVETATDVALRITATLEAPFRIGTQDASVGASIGIAVAGHGDAGADDVLRRADIAMYAAKTSGQCRVAVFDEVMRSRVDGRLSTETALRRAVSHNELELHFQPVVRLADSAVTGMEALLRWHRPGVGLVYPEEFIGVAEDRRLITAIDAWVVLSACRTAASWPDADLAIGVNLSAADLQDEAFLHTVSDALHRTRLSPHRLIVELTETMLMSGRAIALLDRVRGLGVRVAIDDFGKGYSSLSALHLLPADVLKIDASFVAAVDREPAAAAIVGAIVTMGHALGLTIVAEGVERPAQAARLRLLGCDAAQGFLFSRPEPATAAGVLRVVAGAAPRP